MDDGRKHLGRPRKRPAPSGLARRNLLVNPRSLEELRALYDVSSESEAIRRAVDLALLLVTENDADLITWHSLLGDRSTLRIEPARR